MNYLIVVAHPDDEVLGAGATIAKLIDEGHNVAIATMCKNAAARNNLSETLEDEQNDAFLMMGIQKSYSANFPNIKMNTVPHLELVQFIENCIQDFGADAIITHHPSDMNNDHVMTSYATQAASRVFQRKELLKPLKLLLFMEIQSSTEWSFDSSSNRFSPNFFVEIGEIGLKNKIKFLSNYKGVMRSYPHPRSEEGIRGLAAYRGAQSGCTFAEAFECVYYRG